MKTLAAVLVETGKPLELAELEIPRLLPGQVLVEIAFSGVCHTQLLERAGHRGHDPHLPHCLGHEGSGTVIDVGADVTRCRVGDRVILSWIKGPGLDVPGTKYLWNGRTVNAGGVTTFSRHAVVSENRVSAIDPRVTWEDAAFVGCAAPTGLGSVFNTAAARLGQSIAIFGTGGVGLCAVGGAAVAELTPIIAVDPSEERRAAARALGATHVIDPTGVDVVAEIRKIRPGGVDVAIEASGRPEVMTQALAAVRNQGGAAVVVGNARHGEQLVIDPLELNRGKRVLGTWGGDSQPERDFPRYQQLLTSGAVDLAPLRSKPYALEAINSALDDLESKQVIRPLIDMRLRPDADSMAFSI